MSWFNRLRASDTSAERRQLQNFYLWAIVTWVLGAAFIGLEVSEFSDLVARGDGPTHSAFLSAFFTLVGTHGCHVSSGLLWLLVAVFVGLVLRGRSFGPLMLRPPDVARTDVEWAVAVGQLLRRSSARSITGLTV